LTPSTTAASRRFGGNDQVGNALLARADGDGERAAHGAYGAIERELADEDVAIQGLHRAHGAQDAYGDREIEAGAFFAHIGRGQVDGDAFVGVAETGIDERALDALAALADGDVGMPTITESRGLPEANMSTSTSIR